MTDLGDRLRATAIKNAMNVIMSIVDNDEDINPRFKEILSLAQTADIKTLKVQTDRAHVLARQLPTVFGDPPTDLWGYLVTCKDKNGQERFLLLI